MRFLFSLMILACVHRGLNADIVIDFEELPLTSALFYNGDSGIGPNSLGWSSKGVLFNNNYGVDPFFGGFWSGWSYSRVNDTTTSGFGNQYASFPGGGDGSQKYAVAYNQGAYFNLPSQTQLASVSLANTTYTALTIRDGDPFTDKFGGPSGDEPDFFRVKLRGHSGLNAGGGVIGEVTVDLADYTFADNSQDKLLVNWLNVDLTSIKDSKSVSLEFESSDVGPFGVNTPLYLALDNLRLTAVPEPASMMIAGVAFVGLAARRIRKRQATV